MLSRRDGKPESRRRREGGCAIEIEALTHRYPPSRRQELPRIALQSLSLQIQVGEIFCLIGPNGSGKSTLFRILATLLKPTQGTMRIFHLDLLRNADEIRRLIGVVFQNPSLDKKLTVRENLFHQGHLYGIHGNALEGRIAEMLAKLRIDDRTDELVENLSGGLQRRVELAKGLLHQPRLLLLDEPSTGLDPGARKEFFDYLLHLRDEENVTVLLTTHLLDEAERCDRIAILDKGVLAAVGTLRELKQEIGGEVISIASKEPAALCKKIQSSFGGNPYIIEGFIRMERDNGRKVVPQLLKKFRGQIDSITVSKPTLEDVFIRKTGHGLRRSLN